MHEIFYYKTAALLHDPPDKGWYITGHEKRAEELLKNVLKNTPLFVAKNYLGKDAVRMADRVASSIDRWLLSILVTKEGRGEKYDVGLFKVKDKVLLKNVIDPRKYYETIPLSIVDLGKIWLKHFRLEYEKVYTDKKLMMSALT